MFTRRKAVLQHVPPQWNNDCLRLFQKHLEASAWLAGRSERCSPNSNKNIVEQFECRNPAVDPLRYLFSSAETPFPVLACVLKDATAMQYTADRPSNSSDSCSSAGRPSWRTAGREFQVVSLSLSLSIL